MEDFKEVTILDVTDVPIDKIDVPVPANMQKFYDTIMKPIGEAKGDNIPVSCFNPAGRFPSGGCRLEKRATAITLPKWEHENCIQCNQCVAACPHSSIVAKLFTDEQAKAAGADDRFVALDQKGFKGAEGQKFRIQIMPDDCTGCGTCAHICPPGKKGNPALVMTSREVVQDDLRATEKVYWKIPNPDPKLYENKTLKTVGLMPSFFEFSGACAGCGETPYVKMISQLYGDHSYVANATGCSSIYGATAPASPYGTNEDGEGMSWSNSLFEDNAEFGFGMRLASDKFRSIALDALNDLIKWSKEKGKNADFVAKAEAVIAQEQDLEFDFAERKRLINAMEAAYSSVETDEESLVYFNHVKSLSSYLLKKKVWIFGGDGWAYDIGYGGLDHVVASDADVNILVMDTGVYSNTGGQKSKATPLGAVAKFAAAGKDIAKKDLGLMCMSYQSAYVAQIALGANPNHALKAIREAAAYPGPSIILAYSTCIEHGIHMNKGWDHAKLAVESGFWPLYTYDPRKIDAGQNPLELTTKEQKISMEEFVQQERRFMMLSDKNTERFNMLLKMGQKEVDRKFNYYKKLADLDWSK
jgi:pyruvate-ferredoxin/flavodoxin oxidoreductase